MNKTSILIGAVLCVAMAHVAFVASAACAPQATHTYNLAANAGANSNTAGVSHGAGATVVQDNNTADCNGDGVPADFDGDYETGVSGAMFGSGTTWEAACGYGLNVHSTSFVVADLVSAHVHGSVGVDDFTGPVFDPVTGACLGTDGSITPDLDTDDCLVNFVDSATAPCGGVGGDDAYWVFLEAHVEENGAGSSVDGPTAGTVTAAF